MSDTISQAFHSTAEHFGVAPGQVTRDMFRKAKREGVHEINDIRNFAEVKIQAIGGTLLPVPKGHNVKGVSTLLGPDGEIKGQWIKTNRPQEQREELLARLVKELPDLVTARTESVPFEGGACDSDLIDVYPLGDPHIGMMSWAPETGEDFDLKKAEEITKAAIDHLTATATAKTALVLNLGDFFHSDTLVNTTTKGTPVDVDGRMYKVLKVGLNLMIYVIDAALRAHEFVEVDNRNGNHDTVTSMFLSLALEQYYRNEPRIKVHPNTSKFFYKQWGKCLIGATHGDTVKFKSLPGVMAVDQAEAWGFTEHRFWYVGHVHHTSRVEDYGVTIETFRTLAAGDAWHHAKGYRSNHDMNRITLHKRDGEIARSTINSKALKRRYLSE